MGSLPFQWLVLSSSTRRLLTQSQAMQIVNTVMGDLGMVSYNQIATNTKCIQPATMPLDGTKPTLSKQAATLSWP